MPSATSIISQEANYTAQAQAKEPRVTGPASSKMGAQEFLMLMMKQLQYQDPLNPTDNKEFIAQQAQFTQVSTMQEMNKNMSMNSSIMQTLSLVGKQVSLIDPDDKKGEKTIDGIVSEAKFTADGASVVVNKKEYPISLVKSVTEPSSNSTADITSVSNNIIQGLKALPNMLANELKDFLSSDTPEK